MFPVPLLLPVSTLQRCAIDFRVQRAPDKLPSTGDMIREQEQKRGRQVERGEHDTAGAEQTNVQNNRGAECLRK